MRSSSASIGFSLLLSLLSSGAIATTPRVQIHELTAGVNGDSRAQCVQLRFAAMADGAWGPSIPGGPSRALLVFHDASGAETGRFAFPAHAPGGVPDGNGYLSALIGTARFAALPGAPSVDFVLPERLLAPHGGRVTFQGNPGMPGLEISLSLAYGDFAGDPGADTAVPPHAAGPAAVAAPILGVKSLRRWRNFGAAYLGFEQYNADFRLEALEARNSQGGTATVATQTQVEQGLVLFQEEIFGGNGRTCGTCHFPGIAFSLPPDIIPTLPGIPQPGEASLLSLGDPLFINEQVPALAGLESAAKLRGGLGLILENIDGFDRPPSFRASPPLLNLKHTAPFGLSGELTELDAFSVQAVKQHFPRTLARNSDPAVGPLDMRLPDADEQAAMTAFLESLAVDASLDLMLASEHRRGVPAELLRRGREAFFGKSQCFKCHGGPAFAEVDRALVDAGLVPAGGNRSFNTGVAAFAELRGLPGPHETERAFSVRSLIGVGRRESFFHDNSVRGLDQAVLFYCVGCDDEPFQRSPAATLVDRIELDAEALVAFLRALDEPHADCVGGPDCNRNGITDDCELAFFVERDCDGSGVPDACEAHTIDCDRNGLADRCEIESVPALDCNQNGAIDACDIANLTSPDCNQNSTPDECEPGELFLLDNLPAERGAVLNGYVAGSYTGGSLGQAGDLNLDGRSDFLVGSVVDVYAIYGDDTLGVGGPRALKSLVPAGGFVQTGLASSPGMGLSRIGSAGDLNGDGSDEVAIGEGDASYAGRSQSGGARVLLSRPGVGVTGAERFLVYGARSGDLAGNSVSTAGDLNGDGLADLVLGAPFADPSGVLSGSAFVVFGASTIGQSGILDLAGVGQAAGFIVHGQAAIENLGSSVACAGDVNGDAFPDLIVGARGVSPGGKLGAGRTSVIFGSPTVGANGTLRPDDLDGTNGFNILGPDAFVQYIDMTAGPAGDVNGDGYADIVLGRVRVHVVLGGARVGASGALDLAAPPAGYGFVVEGLVNPGFGTRPTAAAAGDTNGDGYDDLLLSPALGVHAYLLLGGAEVGANGSVDVSSLEVEDGVAIELRQARLHEGASSFNMTLSRAGDVNQDGLADVLLGVPGVILGGPEPVGQAFLVHGPLYPADCDHNGVPDSCELADGSAFDVNSNGIVDACEPDPLGRLRRFVRGDANADGDTDVSDAVAIVLRLFAGLDPLPCERSADVNRDDALDLTDALALLGYLFRAGAPPAPPSAACGSDIRPGALPCEGHSACE